MDSFSSNQVLQDAVAMLRAGLREQARIRLVEILRHEPAHELATLWLSATIDDPGTQHQILERVLELNPHNQAAREGLLVLERAHAALPAPGIWTPPVPLDEQTLATMALECPDCGALLYGNAVFCWRCHRSVHCCDLCAFRAVVACKLEQAIEDVHERNCCPWWRPPQ